MTLVYLGLGSNLGDRAANLDLAIERLRASDLKVLRASAIYETEPRDFAEQPWFLNQAVEAETSLFPRQLLHRLQQIERGMGRKPAAPKGPRIIDLDILLFGDSVISAGDLEIPHPRLHERRFALEPLADLAPGLRHPRLGNTFQEMLARVRSQSVRRFTRESNPEAVC